MTKRCCALLCKNTPKCWEGVEEEEDISLTPRIVRLSWILFYAQLLRRVYIYMYILRVRVVGERRGVKIREMWERYDISFFFFSFFKDLVSSANYYIDVYIYIYIYEITKM